jgi:periplasmic protein TonB
MFQRPNALLISLFFHLFIIVGAYFLYLSIHEAKEEKRVLIDLCQCQESCQCSSNMQEPKVKDSIPPLKKPLKQQPVQNVIQKQPALFMHEPVKQESTDKLEKSVEKIVEQKRDAEVVPSSQVSKTNSLQTKEILVSKNIEKSKQVQSTVSVEKEYIQNNLSTIRQLLEENLYYPLSARKRGIQGQVVVKFTLLKNSEIKDIIITKESTQILNDAALRTVQDLNKKLPAPTKDLTLEVPINYQLH